MRVGYPVDIVYLAESNDQLGRHSLAVSGDGKLNLSQRRSGRTLGARDDGGRD